MSRVIWLVRHGERVDNVDKKWKDANKDKWDDPPMTIRGKRQAHEVGVALATFNIERIITSPYTRCVETTVEILAMLQNPPLICVEPGLQEPLSSSMNPPTVMPLDKIKEMTTRVDLDYKPVYEKLPLEVGGDLGCADRVVKTFKEVNAKFPKGMLVYVTHGTPIANLHAFLVGHWKYVGQATLSKVIDNFGNYKLEYYNKKNHLSDQTGVRDDEKNVPILENKI